MNVPTLKTRKPTGKPSWPILLLAGAEKAGKSYSAAQATSSTMIGRSYWVTIGEDQPDEYGQLGDFDIVEHDGTYRGILNTLRAITHQPAPSTGVPLLIVDSMTRLWDLLKESAQNEANARRGGSVDKDANITPDQWNAAASQWAHVMDAIRAFPGPVVLTARLDQVAVMNDAGQPTKEKTSKVQGHRTLPYDVGGIVEMPARGEAYISGLRSIRLRLKERTPVQDGVTEIVPWLWQQIGLEDDDTTPRDHVAPEADGKPFDAEGIAAGLDAYDDLEQLTALWNELGGRKLSTLVDGRPLGDYLRDRKAALVQRTSETPMVLDEPPADETEAYEDEVPF